MQNSIGSEKKGKELLDFIEQDLLQAIDTDFRTNRFRILTGFVGTGRLALYILLNRPELFNAYIVASPGLSRNFNLSTPSLKDKIKQLNNKPRFLFLSIGSHNYEQEDLPAFSSLENILKTNAPKQLDWHIKRFNKNNYMSQPILALVNGIEILFNDIHETLSPDSAISKQGAEAIIDYYRYLSEEKYGFEVSAEYSLKALGFSLLKTEPEKALSVLKLMLKTYPDSGYAHHTLAKAYADLQQFNKAVEFQTLAVEKSKSMAGRLQIYYKEQLEEFKLKLAGLNKK